MKRSFKGHIYTTISIINLKLFSQSLSVTSKKNQETEAYSLCATLELVGEDSNVFVISDLYAHEFGVASSN